MSPGRRESQTTAEGPAQQDARYRNPRAALTSQSQSSPARPLSRVTLASPPPTERIALFSQSHKLRGRREMDASAPEKATAGALFPYKCSVPSWKQLWREVAAFKSSLHLGGAGEEEERTPTGALEKDRPSPALLSLPSRTGHPPSSQQTSYYYYSSLVGHSHGRDEEGPLSLLNGLHQCSRGTAMPRPVPGTEQTMVSGGRERES